MSYVDDIRMAVTGHFNFWKNVGKICDLLHLLGICLRCPTTIGKRYSGPLIHPHWSATQIPSPAVTFTLFDNLVVLRLSVASCSQQAQSWLSSATISATCQTRFNRLAPPSLRYELTSNIRSPSSEIITAARYGAERLSADGWTTQRAFNVPPLPSWTSLKPCSMRSHRHRPHNTDIKAATVQEISTINVDERYDAQAAYLLLRRHISTYAHVFLASNKHQLNTVVQRLYGTPPPIRFKTDRSGNSWLSTVFVNDELRGRGAANSKAGAEENAAANALQHYAATDTL
ncbi:hypothetical protein PUNSTDRAFT_41627 [Punctularia strigosozonata HHB-11173 SS5]|uniref:uncharacterized protein n=1 Tax=Punctularia strigosozonata (strain HHB-11173) TaxID=741275 RepID=UPI0004417096|nr:uncharacterized protein PUNSTDRAFT_41627 [Punctularia strigosozonata HHB-11173 SS5]EIN14397.1 hypothetical protein PUNSTDRAFT_41627 [Punctularia strigosozonata HHB-11173 SS5]